MGSVRDSKGGSKDFCDAVFTELNGMKERIESLRSESLKQGGDTPARFERHLAELADSLDWKIQILAHSCTYDWKGSADFENEVQVDAVDKAPDSDGFSGGYVGG